MFLLSWSSGSGYWKDLVQIDELAKTYSHVPASALLFYNRSGSEVPAIGKEFTNGATIGKGASSLHGHVHDYSWSFAFFLSEDPESFLYYNDIGDLTGYSKYKFTKIFESTSEKPYSRIQFSNAQGCFAEVCNTLLFLSISSLIPLSSY